MAWNKRRHEAAKLSVEAWGRMKPNRRGTAGHLLDGALVEIERLQKENERLKAKAVTWEDLRDTLEED